MAECHSAPAVSPQIKPTSFQILRLTTTDCVLARLKELSILLQDCVTDEFSIGFLTPFSPEDAGTFWREISQLVSKGNLHLFILISPSSPSTILGSIQLRSDTKKGHNHRGDISKVLVFPIARRQGIGRLLMEHVEEFARSIGKDLLTLDTASRGPAIAMYRKLGWEEWGTCKGYAKWPDGSSCDATFFSEGDYEESRNRLNQQMASGEHHVMNMRFY